jgi:hypothetical protein
MTQVHPELLAILATFEKRSGAFDEYDVGMAIKQHLKVNSEREDYDALRDAFRAERLAFAVLGAYSFQDGSEWYTYFGPIVNLCDQDGNPAPPAACGLTAEVVQVWQERCSQFRNPLLVGRYADLIWDLCGKLTGVGPDVRYARVAIEAYVQTVRERRHGDLQKGVEKLRRALSLALSVNAPDLVQMAKGVFLDLMTAETKAHGPRCWEHAYDVLLENKKISLTAQETSRVLRGMEECLSACCDPARKDEGFDPFTCKDTALRLAEKYQKDGRRDDAQRVVLAFGKAFEHLCEQASPLLAMSWYGWVHSAYLQYGLKDAADRVLRLQKHKGLRAKDDMAQISVKHEIPVAELEDALADLLRGDLTHALAGLAICFLPKSEEEGMSLRQLAKEHPLLGRLSISVVSEGQVVARAGSVETDFDRRLIRHVADLIAHGAPFLETCIDRTLEHCGATAEQLMDVLYRSPLYDPARRPLLEQGIGEYLTGEYSTAIHLLVPQIEHILRRYLWAAGCAVNKRDRHGNYQEKTLNDILWEPAVRAGMGDDLTLYLRTLLADQLGWNIRNRLAHGLMGTDELTRAVADRAFHVLLLLGLFRNQNDEGRTA